MSMDIRHAYDEKHAKLATQLITEQYFAALSQVYKKLQGIG